VAGLLAEHGVDVELVTIVTAGDVRTPDTAWGEGAFVGALEAALRSGAIDLAVHSAKDVPIEPETDLVIGAYPGRADARDALVTAGRASLRDLPAGAVIGTDSPRRSGFIRAERPDVRVVPLHGNVDTRLARLDAGEVDALVLAVAGLVRLGRGDRIAAVLEPDTMPPAPGQGALAVQVRADDAEVRSRIESIDHTPSRAAVTFERAVLDAFGGGCRAPLGALAVPDPTGLHVVAGSVTPEGRGRRIVSRLVQLGDAAEIAASLGRELRGAEALA
jgi:hydroxymethylbilane synthase